jgi:hypothetical protein
MQFTKRDQVLMILLPAIVVLAGYGYFFFNPKWTELNRATASLEDARTKAPGVQRQVQEAQVKLAAVQREVATTEKDKLKARQSWDQIVFPCANVVLHNDRVEKLNKLLAGRGLRLVEDAEADGNKEGKLGPALDGLSQQIATLSACPKPQLRKVRLVGKYLDLMAALDDLARSEGIAIPVGLNMKQASLNSSVREWLLLVWV